jgi:ATP-binding protein involved in chromosome partitioning
MTRFARLRDVPAAFRELADDVRAALSDNQTVPVPETALDLRGVPDRARIEQVRIFFVCVPY